jgi:hypothetical protein
MRTTPSVRKTVLALLTLLAALASGATAFAAPAEAKGAHVNVYQYAVDNPVADAKLRAAPTLGASVPEAVSLSPCEGEKTYVYFYYEGQPVIVDRSTRSVVRIGDRN